MNQDAKKKALVLGVGAEKGLGAALCFRFAKEGHHVFVAGRTLSKLELVCETVRSNGGEATPVVCDGTIEADVVALFKTAKDNGAGSIDLAVFNVGNNMPGRISEMEADYFEQAWRLVCFSGFLFGKEAARSLLPRGGVVLFTGASASLRGKASFGAFNSAKSALRTFAQALAKEHASEGLHVGHVIVDGGIAGEKAFNRNPKLLDHQDQLISLEGLTDAYWYLYQQDKQAWTFEMDIRTSQENW